MILPISHINRRLRIGGGSGGGADLLTPVQNMFGGGEQGGIWDFSDSANLATATDGTGAVSNGSLVAYAADLSGNGNHLLQATEASRPTWNSGGYAVWANDLIKVSWISDAQPYSRISRVNPTVWNNLGRIFSSSSITAVLYQTGSSPLISQYAGSVSGGASLSLGSYHTITELFNGASSYIDIDDTITNTNPGTSGSGGLSIGAEANGSASQGGMQISRVVMIHRSLTAQEIADAQAWVEQIV